MNMTEATPTTGHIPEPRHTTERVGACETLPQTPSGTLDATKLTTTIVEHDFTVTKKGFFGGRCRRCLGELMLSAGSPIVLPPECMRIQQSQANPNAT